MQVGRGYGLRLGNVCMIAYPRLHLITKSKPTFYRNFTKHRQIVNMETALVDIENDTQKFKICFRYDNPCVKVQRTFHFYRDLNEQISKFLHKIEWSIASHSLKKIINKKLVEEDDITGIFYKNLSNTKITLLHGDEELDKEMDCSLFASDMRPTTLIIFGKSYELKYNSPQVIDIKLPQHIIIDCPAYPDVFKCKYSTRKDYNFAWYIAKHDSFRGRWTQISNNYWFVPSSDHVGHFLRFTCQTIGDSTVTDIISNDMTLTPLPENYPTRNRLKWTRTKLRQNEFRVVTYNILADMYSDSAYARTVLFPYCPQQFLSMNYRKKLILHELLGFNADIICLQEVDAKVYSNDLDVILSDLDFNSIYHNKPEKQEGLAIFFDKTRFKEISNECTVISENTDMAKFSVVWSKVLEKTTKEKFLKIKTILQSIVLQSEDDTSKLLVVANTHLFYHPTADAIRLLQAYNIITYLENKIDEIKKQNPDATVGLVLCGDFNSTPSDGVFQLLTKNYVAAESPHWTSDLKPDQIKENIALTQNLQIGSACGTPEYTNYTTLFSACLDYIFYGKNDLSVTRCIPLPSKEELVQDIAIPSVAFPSDHISLCAELLWRCKPNSDE